MSDLIDSQTDVDDHAALYERFDESGLLSVGIDEELDGSGGTLADVVAIAEGVGFHGASVPIVTVSIARWIAAESGNAGVLTGVVTAALTELTEDELLTQDLEITAVAWGRHAHHVILCPSDGRPVVVSAGDDGVDTVKGSDLAGNASDTVLVTSSATRVVLERAPEPEAIRARFALLRTACLAGAIRGAYNLTREYVRTREQFGAPLVKLPAVASGIATVRTKVLEADAALSTAVRAWPSTTAPSDVLPIVAGRVVAARCASDTARLAHQLHGAIGTTEEYRLHRLTASLWAWRDADLPEADWATLLGEMVTRAGERATWDSLGPQAITAGAAEG
ncbi:acyl-CoA/acyl-ACP dehydrogenase [Gordonia McavH-238-E]|uniref:acyl-CoA dehydrogenase family protein n=1 Tax=Gordonia sp. McavH-238-E TaxID=2917736 RepID=UPI001EF459BF|nr:acyl-CoA dehydrogenase family protein [Gordonia sp. McavH-238-E]MCG7632822.1 acyl-CoA/acyl-ACP dehydrogenase [Gordonia sp. McavH-238-E]